MDLPELSKSDQNCRPAPLAFVRHPLRPITCQRYAAQRVEWVDQAIATSSSYL